MNSVPALNSYQSEAKILTQQETISQTGPYLSPIITDDLRIPNVLVLILVHVLLLNYLYF